ncbi:MAG: sigma-70 family RNA polymerase sigma factor [Patescibacteria group bacterium]
MDLPEYHVSRHLLERVAGTNTIDASKDEVHLYMAPFMKYPIPRGADFTQLHSRWKEHGDRSAYEAIVYGNARLVLATAYRLLGRGVELLDLLQEGFIGMFVALEKYDISLGYVFSTYASWWIRQAMTRAIMNNNLQRPYRIPVHMIEKIWRVGRVIASCVQQFGQWPESNTILKLIRQQDGPGSTMSLHEIHLCVVYIAEGYISIDDIAKEDDGRVESVLAKNGLYDLGKKVDTDVETRRILLEYRAAKHRIVAEINSSTLDARQSVIIKLRLGLGDFDPLTLEEIGLRYELTRERVRQVEKQAFAKLEQKLHLNRDQIERIVAAVDELATLADDGIEDEDPPSPVARNIRPQRMFEILCEHIQLLPNGRKVIKFPVRVLTARCSLLPNEARSLVAKMCGENMLRGDYPWSIVEVIPDVKIPDYHGYSARPESAAVYAANQRTSRKECS